MAEERSGFSTMLKNWFRQRFLPKNGPLTFIETTAKFQINFSKPELHTSYRIYAVSPFERTLAPAPFTNRLSTAFAMATRSSSHSLSLEREKYCDILLLVKLSKDGTTERTIAAHRLVLATCGFFAAAFDSSMRGGFTVESEQRGPGGISTFDLHVGQENAAVTGQSIDNFVSLLYTVHSGFAQLFSLESTADGREHFYQEAMRIVGPRVCDIITARECAVYFDCSLVARLLDSLVTRTAWDAENCAELARHYFEQNPMLAVYYRLRYFCAMNIPKKYDPLLFGMGREFLDAANQPESPYPHTAQLAENLRAVCVTNQLIPTTLHAEEWQPVQMDAHSPYYTFTIANDNELYSVLEDLDKYKLLEPEMRAMGVIQQQQNANATDSNHERSQSTAQDTIAKDDGKNEAAEGAVQLPAASRKRPLCDTNVSHAHATRPHMKICCLPGVEAYAYTMRCPPLEMLGRQRLVRGGTSVHTRGATTTLCFIVPDIFSISTLGEKYFVLNDAAEIIINGSPVRKNGLQVQYNFRVCLQYSQPPDRPELSKCARKQSLHTYSGIKTSQSDTVRGLLAPMVQCNSSVRHDGSGNADDDERTDYRVELLLSNREDVDIFSYCCSERVDGRTSMLGSSSAYNIFACHGSNAKHGRTHVWEMCIGKLPRTSNTSTGTRLMVSLTVPRIFSQT